MFLNLNNNMLYWIITLVLINGNNLEFSLGLEENFFFVGKIREILDVVSNKITNDLKEDRF